MVAARLPAGDTHGASPGRMAWIGAQVLCALMFH